MGSPKILINWDNCHIEKQKYPYFKNNTGLTNKKRNKENKQQN